MNKDISIVESSQHFTRYTWIMVALWTIIVGSLFLFNFISIKKEFSFLARLEAIASFNKDTVYRRWATQHGGVYVPITKDTPANPYLNLQERDILTPSGRELTLMNPAYMTRQVHELGKKQYGLQGHITSLKPLNPGNAPDSWETNALKSFERGENEITSVEMIDGKTYYRLIRPFITETGCLKCHSHQGYKIGDIRGGISLAVPMEPYLTASQRRIDHIAGGLGILWFIGVAGLWMGMKHIKIRIKERENAEKEKNRYIEELQEAVKKIKILRGMLPICSHCKKIRDDKGYWNKIEAYIEEHTDVQFSHGICKDCADKYYPDMGLYDDET